MKLTVFTDYSLRVLIYLGSCTEYRAAVGDIAQAYGISRNHLLKVMQFLAAEDYVMTTRGRGGGIQLNMHPDHISIGEVVRKAEAGSVLVECFSPATSDCRIEGVCRLREAFQKASQAFYTVLDTYTLSDLIANRTALARRLQMPSVQVQ